MKKFISIALLIFSTLIIKAENPLWLRFVQISPDGEQIVFSYKGDIYVVDAEGGEATQLTTQMSYEANPIWSPDSKSIAFTSDRNGNFDIYTVSVKGGSAKRVTYNSTKEIPYAFTNDGKYILFSATIQDPASSALFPASSMLELYQVPVNGGRVKRVLATPAEYINWSKDGEFFLYQDKKGGEDEYRKHHTSSITRDIWRYDVESKKHTNLTNIAGEDRNPVLSPDGKSFYFLSERDGKSFNVYNAKLDNPAEIQQVTSFKTHPVRFLSIDKNGTLCYTYNGEIYTQKAGSKGKKVDISIVRDDENLPIELKVARAQSSAISPDGKQLAFVYRGEVFVTSTDYSTTKQITHTAAAEKSPTWGDNRTLVYTSERSGISQLIKATIVRDEDLNFPNATSIKEEELLSSKTDERTYPSFSPDGKELAFIENRNKLMVYNLETKKVREVTDGSNWYNTGGGFSYEWSPDSKWFAIELISRKHEPYTDVAIVNAQGGEIYNITNSGYFSESPTWVMEGNAILFLTDRYGMRSHASWGSLSDAMIVFLNQETYDEFRLSKEEKEYRKELEKLAKKDEKSDDKSDKKEDKRGDKDSKKGVKDIVVEIDGLEDRVVRLTPTSSNMASAMITNDGQTLYYIASYQAGYELWKMSNNRETKLISKNSGVGSMEMSKDGKSIYILGSSPKKLTIAGDKLTNISTSADMQLDLAAEREYMFNVVCREESRRFYTEDMHGVDWPALTKNYRQFLPHINNNYDFANMLSELLGELNVSHTGGRYSPRLPGVVTADLGLFFDWEYQGSGLRVEEVIEGSPLDIKDSKVEKGVIIEKIDGVEITPDMDYTTLINDKANVKTLLSLYNPFNGERWEEVTKPVSKSVINNLLYERWIKNRAADVERLSNGRLGYVHIKSMNDGSFRDVYSDILGKYNDKEGIVIDTRFNGGGRLHEDVEILFSGKKYLTQVIRGRESCDMPSRRYNKPSIMIQCEANYSNAHGTPWVYREVGLGKLVGMPVPGTMTSVSWTTLQDPTLVFGIPIVGYRTNRGNYLENSQLEPDFKVANSPETIIYGVDSQLKVAVEELLKQIDSQK